MHKQAAEIELLELAEATEDAMKKAHELVSRLSVYTMERRYLREAERNGVSSYRAERRLRELDTEKKRLASGSQRVEAASGKEVQIPNGEYHE